MPENISVDLNELDGYASKTAGLSEHIGGIAGKHLANKTIGADMLGDLGEESGLHGHLSSSISTLHGAAQRASGYTASLGDAVSRARSDYHADEELHAESFRRLERD